MLAEQRTLRTFHESLMALSLTAATTAQCKQAAALETLVCRIDD